MHMKHGHGTWAWDMDVLHVCAAPPRPNARLAPARRACGRHHPLAARPHHRLRDRPPGSAGPA
eukprot:6923168-Prymnesium_polylepis.1